MHEQLTLKESRAKSFHVHPDLTFIDFLQNETIQTVAEKHGKENFTQSQCSAIASARTTSHFLSVVRSSIHWQKLANFSMRHGLSVLYLHFTTALCLPCRNHHLPHTRQICTRNISSFDPFSTKLWHRAVSVVCPFLPYSLSYITYIF